MLRIRIKEDGVLQCIRPRSGKDTPVDMGCIYDQSIGCCDSCPFFHFFPADETQYRKRMVCRGVLRLCRNIMTDGKSCEVELVEDARLEPEIPEPGTVVTPYSQPDPPPSGSRRQVKSIF